MAATDERVISVDDEKNVRTSDDALQIAMDYAQGRRSCANIMGSVENWLPGTAPGHEEADRQKTIALTEQADAAAVEKWMALAVGLKRIELLRAQARKDGVLT